MNKRDSIKPSLPAADEHSEEQKPLSRVTRQPGKRLARVRFEVPGLRDWLNSLPPGGKLTIRKREK